MSNLPLVSVIVPTKNSSAFLGACLKSIANQTYKNIELIVVDNFSTDETQVIAKKYTKHVYTKGPERSTQRNYAVAQSRGKYVAIIDSDMELTENVIKDCVQTVTDNPDLKAVIIPEESFGEGFWAQCKKLERSFYLNVPWIEAARFFYKNTYTITGGYNEKMVSGEDWDLSQRVAELGPIGRINRLIYHNEGRLSLIRTLKKKYYYAQQFSKYQNSSKSSNVDKQTSIIKRYKIFFSKPKQLLANPFIGVGMILMKTLEFLVGGIGIVKGSATRVSTS